jgi:hypothetical protein
MKQTACGALYFMLVSYLVYSSTLKMEELRSSKPSIDSDQTEQVSSQQTELFCYTKVYTIKVHHHICKGYSAVRSRDSVVSIVTGYGLDDLGSEFESW